MKLKFTVKADMSGVPAKVGSICSDRGLGEFAASEAARMMDKFVPYRDGILAGSARPSAFEVTYSTPYARRMYEGRGITYRRERHPNARSHWDEGINAPDLANAITAYIRGRM